LEVHEIVKLPAFTPVDPGVNAKVPALLCPGAKVKGKVQPREEKPGPVMPNFVMVRFDLPEFVRVSCRVAVFPTATVPKVTLKGLSSSWPADSAQERLENTIRKSADKSVRKTELRRKQVLFTVRPL
jgi:hypothetical protein